LKYIHVAEVKINSNRFRMVYFDFSIQSPVSLLTILVSSEIGQYNACSSSDFLGLDIMITLASLQLVGKYCNSAVVILH